MRAPVAILTSAIVASLVSCAGGARAAPILRIINMLTMMGSKVEEEAKSQEKLFDKAMCYCKESKATLKEKLEKAQVTSEELKSSISETSASKFLLTQEIAGHNADFAAASKILEEQLSMRSKEKADFASQKREAEANIAALGKAVKALEAGLSQQDFLQTRAASLLQGLVLTGKPSQSDDREALTAFLQQQTSSDLVAQDSGEVIGIITQMKEDMEKDLKAMEKTEIERQSAYEALNQAKEKEKIANEEAARTKSDRLSIALTKLADMQQDFEETAESLELDTKSIADLNEDCAKKDHDFAVSKKELREESIALAETVKILNDESVKDDFKKSLPSFFQVAAENDQHHGQSSQQLQTDSGRLMTSRQVHRKQEPIRPGVRRGLDNILALIDRMIGLLGQEQQDDAKHKEMCEAQIQKNTEKKAELEQAIKDVSATIESTQDDLTQVEQDIEEKKAVIAKLDETVDKATSLRKDEHAEHVKVLADNYAANDILEIAKKKLTAFYEKPTLVQVALQDREGDSSSDSIDYNDDSRVAPSFVQRRSRHRRQPHMKQEGLMVIKMLEGVQQELKAQGEESKQGENEAQAEYERLLEDSKKQRDAAVKAITNKEETRATHQEALKVNKDKKNAYLKELEETKEILASLNEDCSNMQYFDIRAAGRQAEVNKLQSAKAQLASGPLASPPSLAQARSLRGNQQ